MQAIESISLTGETAGSLDVDALAVPVSAGEALEGPALDLDRALRGLIGDALRTREHRGRLFEVLPIPTVERVRARRALLYGLGAPSDLDGQRLRFAHHELVRTARNYGYRSLALLRSAPLTEDDLGPAVEGCVMGTWERRTRHTGGAPAQIDQIRLAGFGPGREREVAMACHLGRATNKARDWQNAPANELSPERMAGVARELARTHGLEFEDLGPDQLLTEGYRLLLGVGAGSARPPHMIAVRYDGTRSADSAPTGRTLALVGQGITFDAGGLSLKPSASLRSMRGDMAGAAAVLAAVEVIAANRMPVDVLAVVPAAENVIGPGAQRAGDIWTSASGKTVEVVDTDAEGRLAMADAITFAIRRGATHLVDLATLTRSATRILGHVGTPGLSNDAELWELASRASQLAGERIWPLPTYPEYRGLLRSRSADLRNAGYGEAATVCAGMFLQEFTERQPWVHLDIRGSAWNENPELTSVPRGPLGTGVRLCVRLAELFASPDR